MRIIGLRAEPRGFTWAVLEGTQEVPILVKVAHVEAPATFSFPQSANFLRMQLLQLVSEHKPEAGGLKTPEMTRGQTEAARERLRVEGVLLAACTEGGLKVTQGPLVTLGRLLGVKSAKVLLESDDYRGINLNKMAPTKREAILIGAALLEGENANSSKR